MGKRKVGALEKVDADLYGNRGIAYTPVLAADFFSGRICNTRSGVILRTFTSGLTQQKTTDALSDHTRMTSGTNTANTRPSCSCS